jgi:hypothetical protein
MDKINKNALEIDLRFTKKNNKARKSVKTIVKVKGSENHWSVICRTDKKQPFYIIKCLSFKRGIL